MFSIAEFLFPISVVALILLWISTLFANFALISKYRVPAGIALIFVACWSSFTLGIQKEETKWKLQVADLEIKLSAAQAQAEIASSRIEYVYVDKIQRVKDTQVVVEEKIRDVAVSIDGQCVISKQVIDIHNQAATNPNKERKQ